MYRSVSRIDDHNVYIIMQISINQTFLKLLNPQKESPELKGKKAPFQKCFFYIYIKIQIKRVL